MVGRKKRSTSTRNHFSDCVVAHVMNRQVMQQQQQQQQQHSAAECGYRGQVSNANGACRNGSLADSEYAMPATTYRRRPKQYSNHLNHRNQQNAVNNNAVHNMNGSCMPRSASREAGSASAGSVVSVDADEDGFLSGSGQDIESDDLRSVERRNVGLMTEKMTSSSVGTQTSDGLNSDLLLTMCKMKRWQRVEAIAEVVQCLNAHEQRYIGSCVEAAVRSNSSYLRQYEIRYNDVHFIQNFIQAASYNRLLELAFPVLCLLHSTNRQAAAVYMRLVDRLFDELIAVSANKTPLEKEEMFDSLRLVVSAALHHSAFSVEHKIKLESLRTYLDNLSPRSAVSVDQQGCEASTSENDVTPVVVSRLDAEATSVGDPSSSIFSITVEWSDLRTSYIVRTADQIADLHNRLLDSFPNEAGARTGNPRVLPYLNRSQPGSILGYIRALPDLPARVLVCPIVRDFFYPSRLESSSLSAPPQSLLSQSLPSLNDLRKPPKSSSTPSASYPPVLETPVCHPSLSVAFLPVTTVCSAGMMGCTSATCSPFSIANIPPPPRGPLLSLAARPLPLLAAAAASVPAYPSLLSLPPNPNGLSCCNCAGRHPFAYCSHPTMLQVIASGEYRIDYNSLANTASPVSGAAAIPSKMTGSVVSFSNSVSPPPPVNFSTPPPAPNSY